MSDEEIAAKLCSLFKVWVVFLIMAMSIKRFRALSVAVFVMSFIYIAFAGRAISLLTVVLGSICIVISSKISTLPSREKAILYCIIVIFVLGVFLFLPQIFDAIAERIDSQRLSDRLYEVSSILKYGLISRDTSGSQRLSLYSLSLSTLFKNPKNFFFGVGLHPANVSVLNSWGIGAHSAIIDFSAEYGVIGIVIMINLLRSTYLRIISTISEKRILSMSKIVFLALIVNSILNNTFTVPCFAAVFIFLPLFVGLSDGYEINNDFE